MESWSPFYYKVRLSFYLKNIMSIERGPSPEEMGIKQKVELTEQGREVRNRPRTEVEAEIQNELESIAKQESPLQENLHRLTRVIQAQEQLAKDLQKRISEKRAELADLGKWFHGKKREELNRQIAELQSDLDKAQREFLPTHTQKKSLESTLSELREKRESLTRPAGILAYGGTAYSERRRVGQWPKIPDGSFQDMYGLKSDERDLTFGVGEKGNRRFVIIRQKQNPEARGGYPFTVLIDPGETTWRMYRWNGAQMLKNILNDETLRERFLKRPEEIICTEEFDKIQNLDEGVLPLADEKIKQLAQAASEIREPIVIGPQVMEKPTPERMAHALTALSDDERKDMTYLIGGGGVHGKSFGCRIVWDSGR